MGFKIKKDKKKKYQLKITDVTYYADDEWRWFKKLFNPLQRKFTSPWLSTYGEAKKWRPETTYRIKFVEGEIVHKE